jgi:hypothetical protein
MLAVLAGCGDDDGRVAEPADPVVATTTTTALATTTTPRPTRAGVDTSGRHRPRPRHSLRPSALLTTEFGITDFAVDPTGRHIITVGADNGIRVADGDGWPLVARGYTAADW